MKEEKTNRDAAETKKRSVLIDGMPLPSPASESEYPDAYFSKDYEFYKRNYLASHEGNTDGLLSLEEYAYYGRQVQIPAQQFINKWQAQHDGTWWAQPKWDAVWSNVNYALQKRAREQMKESA